MQIRGNGGVRRETRPKGEYPVQCIGDRKSERAVPVRKETGNGSSGVLQRGNASPRLFSQEPERRAMPSGPGFSRVGKNVRERLLYDLERLHESFEILCVAIDRGLLAD